MFADTYCKEITRDRRIRITHLALDQIVVAVFAFAHHSTAVDHSMLGHIAVEPEGGHSVSHVPARAFPGDYRDLLVAVTCLLGIRPTKADIRSYIEE